MKGIVPSRKAGGGTPGASTDFVSPGKNMGHAKTNPWDTNHLGTAHGAGIGTYYSSGEYHLDSSTVGLPKIFGEKSAKPHSGNWVKM